MRVADTLPPAALAELLVSAATALTEAPVCSPPRAGGSELRAVGEPPALAHRPALSLEPP